MFKGSSKLKTFPRIALVVMLVLFAGEGCRQDSAQWKFAEGMNRFQEGDREQGIELLEEAVKLDPDSSQIKLALAKMLAENCQGDLGLTWCDQVLEQDPDNEDARFVRASCLGYLGRFDEAFREYQRGVSGKVNKDDKELNGLAYHRALANRELDKAARQVNQAIQKVETRSFGNRPAGVPIHVRAVVSASLLSRHVGGLEYVMEPLNDLIVQHQNVWLNYESQLDGLLSKQDAGIGTKESTQLETDKSARKMDKIASSMALLLAARCLIAEDRGDTELADQDRLWIKRINYEPEAIFKGLPVRLECIQTVYLSAMYLDTRGFIYTKLPWMLKWIDALGIERTLPAGNAEAKVAESSYSQALFDLDAAVMCAELNHLVVNSSLFNQLEINLARVRYRQQESQKLIAVLRYHRLKAHQKAEQFDQAALDQKRIEELGFEADCSLF